METSVVSYRASRPSRDLLVAAHQQITREWWDSKLGRYDVFISDIVIQEIEQGDAEAAQDRLTLVSSFPILAVTEGAERLAGLYMREMPLPSKAIRDALHMAIASLNGMNYLVTWNCRHIAQGWSKRRLLELNTEQGIESPVICTPEELGGEFDVGRSDYTRGPRGGEQTGARGGLRPACVLSAHRPAPASVRRQTGHSAAAQAWRDGVAD